MNAVKRLFGVEAKDIQEDVILTPFLDCAYFAHSDKAKKAKGFLFEVFTEEHYSVIKTGVGASFVGDAVMYLAQTPCKKLYFLGSCAGCGHSEVGDILLAEKALAAESFTDIIEENGRYAFVIPKKSLHEDLLKWRASCGNQQEKDVIQQANIATLGSLSQQDRLTAFLKQHGISGVDMEVSAFFSAANKRNCACCALLYVTDIIGEKSFFRALTNEERAKIKEARQRAVTLVCDFIRSQNA